MTDQDVEYLVDDDTVDAVVHLGEMALAFGRVDRITFHPDGTTPESDTDHTVMLGLIAVALARRFYPGLRAGRIAQLALVHDLVEVYAGDTPTLRPQTAADTAAKKMREQQAYYRIRAELRKLPWVAQEIAAYEDLATPEARFVKALDKLLPKITHLLNDAVTIAEQGMTRQQLVARYELQGRELDRWLCDFPELEQLRQALIARVLAAMTATDNPTPRKEAPDHA